VGLAGLVVDLSAHATCGLAMAIRQGVESCAACGLQVTPGDDMIVVLSLLSDKISNLQFNCSWPELGSWAGHWDVLYNTVTVPVI
jgi:hypothetical protein